MKNEVLVVGVGNLWRGDDGIGPRVIAALRKDIQLVDSLGEEVVLLDGALDGLGLFEILREYRRAIVIDAVRMGLAPGTVKVFTPEDVKVKIQSDTLSTHGFGLAEVFSLMKALEVTTEMCVVGIEPASIEFGGELSPVVAGKLEEVIEVVLGLVCR